MKMANRKLFLSLLCLALCAGLTSCGRKAEKLRESIRVEAVERIEMHSLTGLDILLRVRNDTGYKLLLNEASLDIFMGPSLVAGAELCDPVEVPRRSRGSVATRWRLKISDPLAAYVLARRIGRGDISAVAVSFEVRGRGGPARVNICREKMPLSEFLNTFGVTLEELKNYFEP
ncbi:MAG: hypothetical protein K2I62_01375 [Alistipes sp.]|nr:hypothetical protein [Alistipes sp.]MDE7344858.1 hypothetical protein [Alistipes sp.]